MATPAAVKASEIVSMSSVSSRTASDGSPFSGVGAAILAATVERYGDIPPIRIGAVGYGAGTRELEIPNVVRILVGDHVQGLDPLWRIPENMRRRLDKCATQRCVSNE